MNKPQQAPAQRRIDITGRLVRQQQLRARDHRARANQRRALLLAAGQDRWANASIRFAPAHPFQEIDDPPCDSSISSRPIHAEWQRSHVFHKWSCGQASPKILQHDADPPCAKSANLRPCRGVKCSCPNRLTRPPASAAGDRNSNFKSEVLPAPRRPGEGTERSGARDPGKERSAQKSPGQAP